MAPEKKYYSKNYPDLLSSIKLSSENIFNLIKTFELTFNPKKIHNVEWTIQFPMFVYPFYDFIIKNDTIPTQEVYFEHYISFNKAFFDTNTFNSSVLEGLEARIHRTYPSLVRDIYFNKYVKENLPEVNTVYNLHLDIVEGIDLMIEKDNSFYAINLYTDTDRAKMARVKKQYRHTHPFKMLVTLNFPLILNNV